MRKSGFGARSNYAGNGNATVGGRTTPRPQSSPFQAVKGALDGVKQRFDDAYMRAQPHPTEYTDHLVAGYNKRRKTGLNALLDPLGWLNSNRGADDPGPGTRPNTPPDATGQALARKDAVLAMRFRTINTFPVQGGPYHLNIMDKPGEGTATFGMVRDQGRTPHQGLDIQAPLGTPVVAAGSGRVVFSGKKEKYGYAITVDHGNGLYSFYAHMEAGSLVALGTRVDSGSQIGKVGKTGNATGGNIDAHLHFELRTRPDVTTGLGGRIDPLPYLYPLHWRYYGKPDG